MDIQSLAAIPDSELLASASRLAQGERRATAALVAHLAEIETRKLYLGEACSSLFTYCIRVLRLSEPAAYNRIHAARASRRFPAVLASLEQGRVHLAAVRLLAPVLTEANHHELLAAATHKTKREVEVLLARLRPQPDVPCRVRKLPAPLPSEPDAQPKPSAEPQFARQSGLPERQTEPRPEPSTALEREHAVKADVETQAHFDGQAHVEGQAQLGGTDRRQPDLTLSPPAPPRDVVVPLAPERYKVQFTVGPSTHAKLRRAQELLRHRIPNGGLADVVDLALDLLVRDLERQKFAAISRPRRKAPGVRGPVPAGAGSPLQFAPQSPQSPQSPPSLQSHQSLQSPHSPPPPQSPHVAPRPLHQTARQPAPQPPVHQTAHQAAQQAATRSHPQPPLPTSRYIPAAARRAVWERDHGQCAFVSAAGRRCAERAGLEFDHIRPHADGGGIELNNLRLLCRQHNQYSARQFFGVWEADQERQPVERHQ